MSPESATRNAHDPCLPSIGGCDDDPSSLGDSGTVFYMSGGTTKRTCSPAIARACLVNGNDDHDGDDDDDDDGGGGGGGGRQASENPCAGTVPIKQIEFSMLSLTASVNQDQVLLPVILVEVRGPVGRGRQQGSSGGQRHRDSDSLIQTRVER